MGNLNIFSRSFLAGFIIAMAGTVFLSVANPIIGACLFSFGLLFVVLEKLQLYTGRIGNLNLKTEWNLIPIMLIGNYLGTLVEAVLIRLTRIATPEMIERVTNISATKLDDNILSIFILSIFCGILMALAVRNASSGFVPTMIPVVVFILSGFEHSIANMFYFNLSMVWSWKALLYIVVMIIGNGIGAILLRKLTTISCDAKKK